MQVAKTGFYFCDIISESEFEKLCNFMPELNDNEFVSSITDEIGIRYIIGFCTHEIDKSKRYTFSRNGFNSIFTSLNYIVSDTLLIGEDGYNCFIKQLNKTT